MFLEDALELALSTVSTFPYTEGFETGLGQWTQDTAVMILIGQGTKMDTPSNNTGPSSANGGNWYMYTEANGNINNTSKFRKSLF